MYSVLGMQTQEGVNFQIDVGIGALEQELSKGRLTEYLFKTNGRGCEFSNECLL